MSAQPTLRKTRDIGNALSAEVFPNLGGLLWRPEPSRKAKSKYSNASSTKAANGLGYTTVIWRIAETFRAPNPPPTYEPGTCSFHLDE